MKSIHDTAKHILYQSGAMTPLKLQKLCYFAQAWSLGLNRRPLFDELFIAEKSGPICKELEKIMPRRCEITPKDINGNTNHLSLGDKDLISRVLKYYGDDSAQWLNHLAKLDDPYQIALHKVDDHLITIASMKNYYQNLTKSRV